MQAQPARTQPAPQPAAQRTAPAEKPFIAPPPVERMPQAAAPAPAAPVEAAAPPPAPQPRKMPNLFSRVTGSAWSRVTSSGSASPAPAEQREPVMPQMRTTPAPRPAAPASQPAPSQAPAPAASYAAPAAPPPAATAPAAPPVQPRLSGLDPKDRLATSRAEEDLLDIPAFLRRQAN